MKSIFDIYRNDIKTLGICIVKNFVWNLVVRLGIW